MEFFFDQLKTITKNIQWGLLLSASLLGCSDSSLKGTGILTVVNAVTISEFIALIGSAGSSVYGRGIVSDNQGNSYVVGDTTAALHGQTLTGSKDTFIIKFNAQGSREWTRLLGVAGVDTIGWDVTVDSDGNPYVVGVTLGNLSGETKTGSRDLFVSKYDTNGNWQWTDLSGSAGFQTWGFDIAADSSGNVYAIGKSGGGVNGEASIGGDDGVIIKLSNSGNVQWTQMIGVVGGNTQAFGIDINSESIAIVGETSGNLNGETVTGSMDLFVLKLDLSGTTQWTRLLGQAGETVQPSGVAFDSTGHIYACGDIDSNIDGQVLTGTHDAFVTRYDPTGTKQWTRMLGVAGGDTRGDEVDITTDDTI